jgi:RNA polymerase sigma-70 factor, ECF subfamily
MEHLNDQELVHLLNQGNVEAFKQLYGRYWGVLYRHAARVLQDDIEAEDMIQDLFTRLWEKRAELQIQQSFSAYIYAATRNRVLDLFAHKKVRLQYLDHLKNNATTDTAPLPEQALRDKELAAKIEEEVAALPPKMREVFQLSRKNELSYAQISEQLNISDNTVKKQISNALRILRYKLETLILSATIFFF